MSNKSVVINSQVNYFIVFSKRSPELTQKNLFINESICFGKLISFCWQKIQTNIYEKIKPKDDSWFIIKWNISSDWSLPLKGRLLRSFFAILCFWTAALCKQALINHITAAMLLQARFDIILLYCYNCNRLPPPYQPDFFFLFICGLCANVEKPLLRFYQTPGGYKWKAIMVLCVFCQLRFFPPSRTLPTQSNTSAWLRITDSRCHSACLVKVMPPFFLFRAAALSRPRSRPFVILPHARASAIRPADSFDCSIGPDCNSWRLRCPAAALMKRCEAFSPGAVVKLKGGKVRCGWWWWRMGGGLGGGVVGTVITSTNTFHTTRRNLLLSQHSAATTAVIKKH